MERLVFRHLGKFAFRDECPGSADRGIGGRLAAIGLGAKACAIRSGFNAYADRTRLSTQNQTDAAHQLR